MKLDQLNDPIVHADGWIVDPNSYGKFRRLSDEKRAEEFAHWCA
jgi:hypothetical protein